MDPQVVMREEALRAIQGLLTDGEGSSDDKLLAVQQVIFALQQRPQYRRIEPPPEGVWVTLPVSESPPLWLWSEGCFYRGYAHVPTGDSSVGADLWRVWWCSSIRNLREQADLSGLSRMRVYIGYDDPSPQLTQHRDRFRPVEDVLLELSSGGGT